MKNKTLTIGRVALDFRWVPEIGLALVVGHRRIILSVLGFNAMLMWLPKGLEL